MARQGIVPAERFFLGAEMTPDLLLPIIMYRVFVPREVVAATEDGVARFPRAGVDLLALVGARLAVARDVVDGGLLVVG